MKEENRQSFELELRSAVHDISNGILYPEIAIQKILHAFDKAETPASEDWISVAKEAIQILDEIARRYWPLCEGNSEDAVIYARAKGILQKISALPSAPGTKVEDWKDKRIRELGLRNKILFTEGQEQLNKIQSQISTITELQSKYDHMKKRMEAAEAVIESVNSNGGTLSYDVKAKIEWQQLKETSITQKVITQKNKTNE